MRYLTLTYPNFTGSAQVRQRENPSNRPDVRRRIDEGNDGRGMSVEHSVFWCANNFILGETSPVVREDKERDATGIRESHFNSSTCTRNRGFFVLVLTGTHFLYFKEATAKAVGI